MQYYVDGFLLGPNPCDAGGGFTVVDEHNRLRVHHAFHRPMTNNEAELWSVAYAAFIAEEHDKIWTDSKIITYWVAAGRCKARPDLTPMAAKCRYWIETKSLTLEWLPREENLAGLFNESACHV